MFNKISKALDLISNMGWRYVSFRVFFLLQSKIGILKKKFPTKLPDFPILNVEDWRKSSIPFFFEGKFIPGNKKNPTEDLKEKWQHIQKGQFTFFSFKQYVVKDGKGGWHTNPETGFRYDESIHFSEIPDLSEEAGDIKFVWEKARFSFLYDVIRYDYHFDEDCAEFVFQQIESFIDHNILNLGPNYKCSQEISLRILNWTFAIYYYKDSHALSNDRFQKIMKSIYGQLHHVYHNIHFSRIAVRNNHAITEALMLFLSGLIFPFFPNVKKWSKQGKEWFEKEIEYQIYEDGTFLQFSMNYHRVVVQLLSWGIRLSELNGISLNPVVYERAKKSLQFLDSCMDPISGKLPNYGANDGALFFPLHKDEYRVYRGQLNDLRAVLYNQSTQYEESIAWYGIEDYQIETLDNQGVFSYPKGGYYIAQEADVKTFIRCGAYKDRPSQSDNLHVDIWKNGVNYLWDAGSYKYNTSIDFLKYFNGVEGHNTLSVDGNDQMQKGGRFIWYKWMKNASGKWFFGNKNDKDVIVFQGQFDGFRHIGGASHLRKIEKIRDEDIWEVYDEISNIKSQELTLYWHLNPAVEDKIQVTCEDTEGRILEPIREVKYHSSYYGTIQDSIRLSFKTHTIGFRTKITIL